MNQPSPNSVVPVSPLHRHAWIVALILVALLAMQVRSWWRPTRDGTGYLSIARSVVIHCQQDTPLTRYGDRNIYYAPGYPILISPAFWFSDRPFLEISLIHLGMACVFLAGVYVWARPLTNPNAAMILTALVAVNVSFWNYYRTTVSELAMMMWMIWAVVALRKILSATSTRDALLWSLTASLLVFAAGISRQVGCFVVGGFFFAGAVAWRQKKAPWHRVLLGTLITALPIALILIWLARYDKAMAQNSSAETSRTYLNFLRQGSVSFLSQILEGFRLRISEIGRLLLPGMYKSYGERGQWLEPSIMVYIPLTGAILWGWCKSLQKTNDVLLWTMPIYVGMYILWSFDADTRYFTPILPVLWLCAWYLIEKIPTDRRTILIVILCVSHVIVSVIYWQKEIQKERGQWRRYWPAVQHLLASVPHEQLAPTVSINLPDSARLQWMFLTDRLAPSLATHEAIPDKFHYALMAENEPIPEGFELHKIAGSLKLARRMKPNSTQTTQP